MKRIIVCVFALVASVLFIDTAQASCYGQLSVQEIRIRQRQSLRQRLGDRLGERRSRQRIVIKQEINQVVAAYPAQVQLQSYVAVPQQQILVQPEQVYVAPQAAEIRQQIVVPAPQQYRIQSYVAPLTNGCAQGLCTGIF